MRSLAIGLICFALAGPASAEGNAGEIIEPQIVRPPAPSYPASAINRNLNGSCIVQFDLDARGRPQNIAPSCSHPVFCHSAVRALRGARYSPKKVDGTAVPATMVIYPLDYRLSYVPPNESSPPVLTSCNANRSS